MQWYQLYRVGGYLFFLVSMVIGGRTSGVANIKVFGSKMFDFRQTTALLFGTPLLKA